MKKNNYRTPLNYLGNKSRIADKVLCELPESINTIVEPFAGSAVISLNSNSDALFLNDESIWTIELLKYFNNNSPEKIIKNTMEIINKYNLSHYDSVPSNFKEIKHEGFSKINKEGFNQLKKDFNQKKTIDKLFVLLIYSFNHYLRFNSKKEFNAPVGKTHYYKKLDFLIFDYCKKIQNKNIVFKNSSFLDIKFSFFDKKDTIFYIDPPYLITNAPYNNSWSKANEVDLYKWVTKLHNQGYKFIISNVLEANGQTNLLLKELIEKLSLTSIEINRRYLNSNYRKLKKYSREVLIKNY